jgi:hypothetical protein
MMAVWAASLFLGAAMAAPADNGGRVAAERGPRTEMPAGLQEAMKQSRYRIREQKGGGAYQAFSPSQDLHAAFTGTGMSVTSRAGSGSAWQFGMRLRGYGYGPQEQPVTRATLASNGNRIEYQRGQLTEWYVNGDRGIEQGFTLQAPPGKPRGSEALVVHLDVDGGLTARVNDGRDEATFVDAQGKNVLRYSDLAAFDATGARLAAHLRASAGEMRLEVEDRGAVYPLTIDPLVATETILLPSHSAAGDQFGIAVAIDGDTAIVGANQDSTAVFEGGSVFIFVRSGATWSEQANLYASDPGGDASFGTSVALSGDTAVVGNASNEVYVFVRSGTVWSQQALLLASDAASAMGFGRSAAISGDTIVVGAPANNNSTGAVYIFVRTGTDWTQQAELSASDGQPDDHFGYSVAIDGDTAAVGANFRADKTGAVYIYVRSGTSWQNTALLAANVLIAGSQVGQSVAISGDTVVAGAPFGNSEVGNVAGSAYVFFRSGTIWNQQAQLLSSDGAASDNFGYAVAISGDIAVVTARGDTTPAGAATGSAYVFTRSGAAWSQQIHVIASDAAANDTLGWSAGISGSTFIVGAHQHDTAAGANAGEAYIYTLGNPVTINSAPSGLAFTVTGDACQAGSYTTPQTLTWNSSCAAGFTSPQTPGAGTQEVFTAWADGPTDAPRTFPTPTAAIAYTANFDTQYQLTTLVSPAGAGAVTGGGLFYDSNSNAPVTATANAGYQFFNWTGPVAQTSSNPTTVPMSAAQTVTANFQLITSVTVGAASGQAGAIVTLSATIGPAGQAFADQLQFQVAGVNAGSPIPITGSGTYTTSYTITQGAGTYPISAVLASTSFASGGSGGATLTVTLKPQTISFSPINSQVVGASFPLSATATSNLPVTFTASPTSVCTVSGTTATMKGAGMCTITASQGGDNVTWAAAPPVLQTFTVTGPAPNFTITPIPGSETIPRGILAGFLLELQSQNKFNGSVKLSCSGGPPGAVCADLPQTVKVNGTAFALSGILFPANTKPGSYTMTFTGVSGSLTNSTTATFTIK